MSTYEREQIGPYRIEELLGSGGMGEVYRAYDERLDRLVAIKRVHTDSVSTRALERFLNEARMAARLSHPTIVQIYHVEHFDGDDCIVMEYVEGETLADLLRRGPLSLTDTLRLACELAEGLVEAHRKGIIHRDLKPENVMLVTERSDPGFGRPAIGRMRPGQAKILDFGLARPRFADENDYEATPEHTLIGTPVAMSPEQVHHHGADQRSDLFAFGTLLYHMATGESPFRGRTVLQILNQVCYHHPPPVDQVNPEVPAELSRLISRLQEKRPEHRPQSAREVSEALAEIARSEARGLRAALPRASILHDERRQITVLRYVLGPEEGTDPSDGIWRDVEAFNQVAAERIRRRMGRVRCEDDEGLTAFFGFPRSPEDAAQQAVGAARELIACCAERFARRQKPLTLRVAAHTGVARMGERPGGGRVVFGADAGVLWSVTDELARGAEPGTAVVSEATQRLVTRHFVCRSGGRLEAKNSDRGIAFYRVERQVDRRGVAARSGPDGLVGRRRELELLAARWRLSTESRGQVAYLVGDPGIGKTRLVWALRQHLDLTGPQWLACRCEPAFQSSALRPVISLLWQILGVGRQASAAQSRARLAEVLEAYGQSSKEGVLAALLGLVESDAGRFQRRSAFEAVIELVLALAAEKPRLWVIEDLHFVDPSTLELLGLLFEQVPAARLTLVLTFRPRFKPPWGEPTYLTRLNLGSLSREQVEELVNASSGGRRLPGELLEQIVELVDGVPLFVEELTRFVIESDMLVERAGRYELSRPGAALRIPATLNDALMARLDHLGSAKQLAQLASVFGRELRYDTLRAVAPFDREFLDTGLERLVAAELLYHKGLNPARYVFKHTLIQQAAYESLLEDQRRAYHAEIARVLEGGVKDGPRLFPEVVAHHYTQAEDLERAVGYYLQASRKSYDRIEAIRHLEEGKRLLDRLGESSRRRDLEERYHQAFLEAERRSGAEG